MINKVGMIILLQSKLDLAVEFYKNLGLDLKFHLKDSWAEFDLNGVKIGLCPISQEGPDAEQGYRTGLVLEVSDLHEFYEQHHDTICFVSEPIEKVHGIMVGIKDPSGNVVDLYQPTPEKVIDLVKEVKDKEGAADSCCKGPDASDCGSC